jgi:subtilisin family serine protease
MKKKFFGLALIVMLSFALAIPSAYAASAKVTGKVGNLAEVPATTADVLSDDGWVTVLENQIKTSSQKDLFVDVSMECGLTTNTRVMSKKLERAISNAEAAVYVRDIVKGIRYAADNGANIVSMSLGGDVPDPQVLSAVDYAVEKGVLVIAAAGNDGPSLGSIDYPAAYEKVVAVGAVDENLAVASWSSRGINDGDGLMEEQEVEFGTPGVSVESTNNDGCYTYKSGTSMATPHVSGLAAKLWQSDAQSTRYYLQQIVTIDIVPSGIDPATGFGVPTVP